MRQFQVGDALVGQARAHAPEVIGPPTRPAKVALPKHQTAHWPSEPRIRSTQLGPQKLPNVVAPVPQASAAACAAARVVWFAA